MDQGKVFERSDNQLLSRSKLKISYFFTRTAQWTTWLPIGFLKIKSSKFGLFERKKMIWQFFVLILNVVDNLI
jgi:hypothetical protein